MKKAIECFISAILFTICAIIWIVTIPRDDSDRIIIDSLLVLHCCCAFLFTLASIAFFIKFKHHLHLHNKDNR